MLNIISGHRQSTGLSPRNLSLYMQTKSKVYMNQLRIIEQLKQIIKASALRINGYTLRKVLKLTIKQLLLEVNGKQAYKKSNLYYVAINFPLSFSFPFYSSFSLFYSRVFFFILACIRFSRNDLKSSKLPENSKMFPTKRTFWRLPNYPIFQHFSEK